MKKDTEKKVNCNKRKVLFLTLAIAAGVCAAILMPSVFNEETQVKFNEVSDKNMPTEISDNIIPEYKDIERALACMIDDDVYVIVTRGEKPSSGFHVSVDKMVLEEKDDKSNLIVYSLFEDPQEKTPISQITTFPLCVVKTDLKSLPDTIELRIQY